MFKFILFFIVSILVAKSAFAQGGEFTAFDLYLGDVYKGLVTAHYTENSVTIENTSEIPEILQVDKDKEKILPLFTGTIEGTREVPDVGNVIVDTNTFKVTVYLNEEFHSMEKSSEYALLKSTESVAAIRSEISGFHFTEEERSSDVYRTFNDISAGDSWIRSIYSQDQEGEKIIDEVSANTIIGRWKASGGYLQTLGKQLVPSTFYSGVSLKTEPLLLKGSDALRGSHFYIFVPTTSKVEFYKEGALIDVQVISAGRKEVDTTRFPQGSYFVDVVINDATGLRKERQFFAKSGFLTTRGAPQFQFDVGKLRIRDDVLDTSYYQALTEWRVLDPVQLNLTSFGTEDKQTGVVGFNTVIQDYLLFGASSLSTNSKRGYSIGGGGPIFGVSVSGDYEKSEVLAIDELELQQLAGDVVTPIDSFLSRRVLDEGIRKNLTVSKWIGDLELRYNYTSIERDDKQDFKTRGPTARYRIKEDFKDSLYLEFAKQDTNTNDVTLSYLTWQRRLLPITTTINAGMSEQDGKRTLATKAGLQYFDLESRSGRGIVSKVEIESRQDPESERVGTGFADLSYGTQYGGFIASGGKVRAPSTSATSSMVGGNLTITLDRHGNLATGPGNLGDALVVVDLKNKDEKAFTDVIFDGQAVRSIEGSQKVIFGIAPYQDYYVRIRPSDNGPIIDYDNTTYKVNLYPGHVQYLDFNLTRVFVAIGKLTDKTGNPLGFKRIKGANDFPLTSEDGSFQIEINGKEDLSIELDSGTCKFKLPPHEENEYYFDYGDVICE